MSARHFIAPDETPPLSLGEMAVQEPAVRWSGVILEAILVTAIGSFLVCTVVGLIGVLPPSAIPADNAGQLLVWLMACVAALSVYLPLRFLGALRAWRKRVRTRLEETTNARLREAKDTAAGRERKATALLESAARTGASLTDNLRHTRGALDRARFEFQENAFGPFWDAVEEAAVHLGEINQGLQYLAQAASDYYTLLSGRRHSFPVFAPRHDRLPPVAPVVSEFQQIVRLGQTNYQFANIWEHRRTRAVLISGFRTLGDAISNLGDTIDSSLDGWSVMMSSQLAQVVEEQIALRSQVVIESNRLLDRPFGSGDH